MTDKIQEIYSKYKVAVWPVGSGLASLIILALLVIPQLFSYLDTKKTIGDSKEHLDQLEVKAADLKQIDEGAVNRNLRVVLTTLPTEQDIPRAMAILHSWVARSGLSLRNAGLANTQVAAGGNSFQFSVTVAGPIILVRDFIINLQNAPQVFQIGSIRAKLLRSESAMEIEMPVSVFYEPLGKGGQALGELALTPDEEELLRRLERASQALPASASASTGGDINSVPLGKPNPFE